MFDYKEPEPIPPTPTASEIAAKEALNEALADRAKEQDAKNLKLNK